MRIDLEGDIINLFSRKNDFKGGKMLNEKAGYL